MRQPPCNGALRRDPVAERSARVPLLVQSDSRCCRATDYRLCLKPSASGTRRRRQWAGRRDACTPSFAAAVWEIVQISRLRPDRESEVCLPSFLRPRRVSGASGCDDSPVSVTALTSAEISLPAEADGQRVSDRIAVLADTVDVVGLTDNHAGQPRMSPLAAVALAREQGVGTIVHVSCRDRNRLALQSQVVGAAALGAEGVLCMQGDPVAGVDHVADMTATELIARAPGWSVPHSLAVGAVVNPFAEDLDRELRLLQRKVAAGATFVQSQMVFDLPRLEAFLARGEDMLAGVRVYASVALLRSERMAERACALPGVTIPEPACAQIRRGGGIELARELAAGLARVSRVDALHVFPLGAEAATREVAAEFRVTRGINSRRR